MFQKEEAEIAKVLKDAAKNEGTCSFRQIFSLFPEGTTSTDVYQVLESAARAIEKPEIANYSSLMAKKETGCPGDGFFDTFKIKRSSEYESIAGKDTLTLDLTQEQKVSITTAERKRVYAHVSNNHL